MLVRRCSRLTSPLSSSHSTPYTWVAKISAITQQGSFGTDSCDIPKIRGSSPLEYIPVSAVDEIPVDHNSASTWLRYYIARCGTRSFRDIGRNSEGAAWPAKPLRESIHEGLRDLEHPKNIRMKSVTTRWTCNRITLKHNQQESCRGSGCGNTYTGNFHGTGLYIRETPPYTNCPEGQVVLHCSRLSS